MSAGPKPGTVTRRRDAEEDAALWRRFKGRAGEDARFASAQRLKLASAAPSGFSLYPRAFIPQDRQRGEALLSDVWRIGMEREQLAPGETPWRLTPPSKHFADRVHRFDWLNDLITRGPAGEDRARLLVDEWVDVFGGFDGFAWRAGPLADRVWNWMLGGRRLFETGEPAALRNRLEAFTRQVRHLEESIDASCDPAARWKGACALVAVSICLFAGKELDQLVGRLETETSAQILPDGGHVQRSPSLGLAALFDFLTLADLFERSGRTAPEFITRFIPRMGAMVQFFRSGDRALEPFNNGDEARPEQVTAALNALDSSPRHFMVSPKSGFQKLEKRGVRLVLDCGAAPLPPFADAAHAGALGFELSDGPSRIVTSCGYSPLVNLDWQAAVRRTRAHSTLCIAGRDSAPFQMREESRLLAPSGPEGISSKRLEEEDEIWLDAQHGGYKAAYGLLHRRRLFMSADGRRVTGEDSLVRPVSQGESRERRFVNYEIRFHLHPTITAMMGQDYIRLTLENGMRWRFKTSHPKARIEKTIYLGRGTVERSEQIVLAGQADPNSDGSEPPNCVRWAFLKDVAS